MSAPDARSVTASGHAPANRPACRSPAGQNRRGPGAPDPGSAARSVPAGALGWLRSAPVGPLAWAESAHDLEAGLASLACQAGASRATAYRLLACAALARTRAGAPALAEPDELAAWIRSRVEADVVGTLLAAAGQASEEPEGSGEEPLPACAACGAPYVRARIGRPRRYCSPACRKRAHRARRAR